VGHSEFREGIQRVRGHADAVGHSQSQEAFKDFGRHSVAQGHSKYAYIVGLRRIQGIKKYIQESRGMFRVLMGIQQKKRVKGVLG
jgi:hypothetical protein